MIQKTRGIVFRFTKFGETSIIVTVFTELFGLQSYMVNGVRSKSARSKIALYQPLTLLDLVVYHRENANIERIKEIRCLHPYTSLLTDVKKSTIALFLTEVLNKSVKEESHAAEVFEFISSSLLILDSLPDNYENFHLMFLLKLSRYLGFGAEVTGELLGARIISEDDEQALTRLLESDYTQSVNISSVQRRSLLDIILKFFSTHVEGFKEVKSLDVLRQVLH